MPTRIRKIRKQRGSRSHGWGQSAGHRGAGSRGGVGNTGGHKHRWTYTVVNEPDYFRKHGFHHYSVESVSLNVGELDQISKTLLSTGHNNPGGTRRPYQKGRKPCAVLQWTQRQSSSEAYPCTPRRPGGASSSCPRTGTDRW